MLEAVESSPDADLTGAEVFESPESDPDAIEEASANPELKTQSVDHPDPGQDIEQARTSIDQATADEIQTSDASEVEPKPRSPLKFETFKGPKNRFSKRFGEIPMIG